MVEETYLPRTISVPGITDAEFARLCEQYENYRVEYTSDGELLVMPPTDEHTSEQNGEIFFQLKLWRRSVKRGRVTDSSGGFTLPSGARLAPDAAWISKDRPEPRCPEFVIELLSPTDRRNAIHAKMLQWIENGAGLGWMIDPRRRTVTIYRPGREPEIRTGVSTIAGEGPVEGFVLDLEAVWNPESGD